LWLDWLKNTGPKTEKARKSTIYELLKQFEIHSSGEQGIRISMAAVGWKG